ncbi:hypothetical protein NRB20_28440 [Nocardia sp. RB20]|uniref:Uncharacterized protein n=1 Tax=Nocardia macrotermitis TaxID=2585198 RepID=A0A7K0D203_9NOCA|nr:hypothetical protein [Nocardia macrotermitis]
MHAVDSMRTQAGYWLPNVAGALVIAGVAAVLGRVVMHPVAKRFGDPARGRILGRFAAVLVWGVGAAVALGLVGVPASITLPILGTVVMFVGGALLLLIAVPVALSSAPRHIRRSRPDAAGASRRVSSRRGRAGR